MKQKIKKLSVLLIAFSLYTAANAQQNTVGLSIGFGKDYNYYKGSDVRPTLIAHYDRNEIVSFGNWGSLSAGIMYGYKSAKHKINDFETEWKYNIIGVRPALHFNIDKNKKFDVYAGSFLGMRFLNFRDNTELANNNKSTFTAGYFAGGSYKFTKNLSVFAEAGNDISNLRTGIQFHF